MRRQIDSRLRNQRARQRGHQKNSVILSEAEGPLTISHARARRYYVYIVTNKNHHVLYIGVTGDLPGRIHQHREKLTEGFTKMYQATKLIYYEGFPDPKSAIAREKQLKGWRRSKKIALIDKLNPRWADLLEPIMEHMIIVPRV